MAKTVGTLEAKTHLSTLLDEVARGQEIVITRRGKPLAKLAPLAETASREALWQDIFRRIHSLRARLPPGQTARDLVHAGRKH